MKRPWKLLESLRVHPQTHSTCRNITSSESAAAALDMSSFKFDTLAFRASRVPGPLLHFQQYSRNTFLTIIQVWQDIVDQDVPSLSFLRYKFKGRSMSR